MPSRKRRRTLTTPQKIRNREKNLALLESEIRVKHARIAELQDEILHAERLRAETLRELAELKGSSNGGSSPA